MAIKNINKIRFFTKYLVALTVILALFIGWHAVSLTVFYSTTQVLREKCTLIPYYFINKDFTGAEKILTVCREEIGKTQRQLNKFNKYTLGIFGKKTAGYNKILLALNDLVIDGQKTAQLGAIWQQSGQTTAGLWPFALNNFSQVTNLNSQAQKHYAQLVDLIDKQFPLSRAWHQNYLIQPALAAKAGALINEIEPYSQIFIWLMGYDQPRTFLVFFQNSSELRPTGGFWGSYGLLKTANGRIVDLTTDDIYHLDVNLIGKKNLPPAPEPLAKYLQAEQWYLRDANWSPDYAEAADAGEFFYQAAGGSEKVDGVLAITPQLVEELLAFLGPIEVNGELYSRENFLAEFQYEVERGYQEKNLPSWNRKDIIQAMVDKILEEFPKSVNDLDDLEALINILDSNLDKKNILIHANNPQIQEYLVRQNWAGAVRPSYDDYFLVVDANLASFKTDPYIDRKISYQLEPENSANTESSLIATLTINYNHRGHFDWKTTRYRTYTRVYAPVGSQLLAAAGAMENDRNSLAGEAAVYEENGKTVFGAFIAIEPQKGGQLTFRYRLPDRINQALNDNRYHLLIQKQPGADNQTVQIKIKTVQQPLKVYWNLSNYFMVESEVIINDFALTRDNHLIIKY
ncbi:DUF4012 domain-containing protein [Patescibacteria group bacterium]|nr:DUF4012 domain-containing protein [Patescibacteria group bacterium]